MPSSGSSSGGPIVRQRYVLAGLVPRIAPNLHHWSRSVLFSIDRLHQDVEWTPEWTFPAMVERTYEWFIQQSVEERTRFDFSWEDDLIVLLKLR